MKWLHKKIDAYIIKYHSNEYIRRDLISDEIKKRIDKALALNNKMRDEQEKEKLESQKLKFDIVEYGYIAEIQKMEEEMKRICTFQKEVKELYFKTEARAKQLAMITAENKHIGEKIISSVAANIGQLNKIEYNANSIEEEITKQKEKEENIIGVYNAKT